MLLCQIIEVVIRYMLCIKNLIKDKFNDSPVHELSALDISISKIVLFKFVKLVHVENQDYRDL